MTRDMALFECKIPYCVRENFVCTKKAKIPRSQLCTAVEFVFTPPSDKIVSF